MTWQKETLKKQLHCKTFFYSSIKMVFGGNVFLDILTITNRIELCKNNSSSESVKSFFYDSQNIQVEWGEKNIAFVQWVFA